MERGHVQEEIRLYLVFKLRSNGSRQYDKVCGRIIGYQLRSPEVFQSAQGSSIEDHYVDGVIVTHGTPHQHIWTFAGGLRQDASCNHCACPCDQVSSSAILVPPFVGQNYFCETGVNHHVHRQPPVGWAGV